MNWLRRNRAIVSPEALTLVARERDEAIELADKRRKLLVAISRPTNSDATERQVLKRIRSHLRESARG